MAKLLSIPPEYAYFSIFIPTYNRADLLPRALESIEQQSFKDFHVVVIDDGSTDHSKDLVEAWSEKVDFPVVYHWQKNQGKHAAHNTALDYLNSELTVILDSDDKLAPGILAKLKMHWEGIPEGDRAKFAAVEGLTAHFSGEIAGDRFPKDVFDSNYIEIRKKYAVRGDKKGAVRSDILKEFPYPQFPGERHIRPSILWERIAWKYLTRYVNEVVQLIEYQPTGLSSNRFALRMRNPQGFRYCYLEQVNERRGAYTSKELLDSYIKYIRYSFHSGLGFVAQFKDIRFSWLWLIGLPIGYSKYLSDQLRLKRSQKHACKQSYIAIISPIYSDPKSAHGGITPVVRNLAHAFGKLGYQVDLLINTKKLETPPDSPAEYIRIVPMRSRHRFSVAFELARYLRKERPDFLLAAGHRYNLAAAWAKRFCPQAKVYLSVHNTISAESSKGGRLKLWKRLQSISRFYPWADGVIAVSQGVKDDLVQSTRLQEANVSVVYNPIFTPELIVKSKEAVMHPWFGDGEPPVVIGVGRLEEQKAFDVLIKAIALVRKTHACRLMILGEGKLRAELLSLCNELGLSDDALLAGFVDNPFAYVMRSRLFVLSSAWEGFGNVIVEALAVGTPVVSTDCPSGPSEILGQGKYGVLVAVGDVEGLARAICNELDQSKRSISDDTVKRFDAESSAKSYLEVMCADH